MEYLLIAVSKIILTHYLSFIRRFCEFKDSREVVTKFLEIGQNSTTSFLTSCDREKFEMSKYEEVFVKIYGFINKMHSESIRADLRPFLENLYIPTVFAKQIHDKNVDCSTLEKKIDGIFDNNDDIKTKFHQFRITLNPDSHLFTTNNDEDLRTFATEMMNYLYSFNFV